MLGLVLLVGGHAAWRDLADPCAHRVEDFRRFGVVDARLAVVDDVASAGRGDPLERVAGQALVGIALEDEAVEVLIRLPLARLDLLRHREEACPRLRRGLVVVLLQEIRAVVQDPVVAEPRHRHELAADGVVRDDRLDVELRLFAELWLQVDQVRRKRGRPGDVDHRDVDRGRMRRERPGELRI